MRQLGKQQPLFTKPPPPLVATTRTRGVRVVSTGVSHSLSPSHLTIWVVGWGIADAAAVHHLHVHVRVHELVHVRVLT